MITLLSWVNEINGGIRVSSRQRVFKNLFQIFGLMTVLLSQGDTNDQLFAAQQHTSWPPQQTIPGYHPETAPPVLLADQNRTVHAFSSQWIGEDGSQSVLAINYNQWTLNGGWTEPNDILLPAIKDQARLLDGLLDETGIMHVAFFSGDDTEANIYYAKAPALEAHNAYAWSEPTLIGRNPLTPENGAIAGDEEGNLVIVYSGGQIGNGFYASYSSDRGETWSEPVPIFLAYQIDLTPTFLHMHQGQSGWLHAVWSVNDIANHGQAIYYANFNFANREWSEPLELAETQGGLGTQAPRIVEHDDSLIVMYYEATGGKQNLIRSTDGGQTWTDPIPPFPHVGLNGPGDFVVDANDDLHYFWAQRITAGPDIHGVWHSVWQGNGWSEPEAVVSGPTVADQTGDKAFDPYDVQAVVSQGNVLLVTWRSDPGLKGNGVWYSFFETNAPELPLAGWPTLPEEVSSVSSSATPSTPVGLTPENQTVSISQINDSLTSSIQEDVSTQPGPATLLSVALFPVALLSLAVIMWTYGKRR